MQGSEQVPVQTGNIDLPPQTAKKAPKSTDFGATVCRETRLLLDAQPGFSTD